jgi:hypothetical protein
VGDEFLLEVTLKPVPSDRCVFFLFFFFVFSLCTCSPSVRITFRIQNKILLDPQTNAGPTIFLSISVVLFHLLLSLGKVQASNYGREAGYTSCHFS